MNICFIFVVLYCLCVIVLLLSFMCSISVSYCCLFYVVFGLLFRVGLLFCVCVCFVRFVFVDHVWRWCFVWLFPNSRCCERVLVVVKRGLRCTQAVAGRAYPCPVYPAGCHPLLSTQCCKKRSKYALCCTCEHSILQKAQ